MTPNEILFSLRIGRYSFILEWVPREVSLSNKFEFQHDEGYMIFGIGRLVTVIGKEDA